MIRPRGLIDPLDPWCWACGAQDGDYDDFVGRHLSVVMCEPWDERFVMDRGVQWFCCSCIVGWTCGDPEPSPRGWFAGARMRTFTLIAGVFS